MTSIQLVVQGGWQGTTGIVRTLGPIRMAILGALLLITIIAPGAGEVMAQSASDAFLQVTVFVAATLAIFYSLETVFKIDPKELLAKHQRAQVPIAAALGALPGCGGAVMVITQYIRGGISFGSVVSVLTATMGDAAFLFLAQAPMTGLGIFAVGFVVGVVSGYLVDAIHGTDFMRYTPSDDEALTGPCFRKVESRPWRTVWIVLCVPGLLVGGLIAFNLDTAAILGTFMGTDIAVWLGAAGAFVSMLLWGHVAQLKATRIDPNSAADGPEVGWASASRGGLRDASARVVGDTCFVTVWVIFAYLIFDLGLHFTGFQLEPLFKSWAPLVPMLAILVGFIPGCGPQVMVATMYLSGAIPLSAELGNAISNDGDALFPAIAMAPKAAVVATAYSAIPAIIIAYGYYGLFE